MRLFSTMTAGLFAAVASQACAQAEVEAPVDEIKTERLVELIEMLPVSRTGRADDAGRRGLYEAEDILIDYVRGLGFEPQTPEIYWNANMIIDREAPRPQRAFRNVIFETEGTDEPEKFFLIAAHFDAVPRCPGADDNGTGVAALLEIARLIEADPRPYSVMFCLYNLEEIGLMGSRAHYREILKPQLDRGERELIGMISIDGIGFFSDEEGSQGSPIDPVPGFYDPPTVGDFLALATTAQHRGFNRRLESAMLAVSDDPGVFRFDVFDFIHPQVARSDHSQFLIAGYPAVMVTDTAEFRSPHYHKPTDTIDTLDLERYTTAVKQLLNVAWVMSDAEK